MPRLLSIREICERSLRKIGSYSINDDGARAEEMEEAQQWLDLIVGHLTGRRRTWWLVPVNATIPLVAGQASYTLDQTLFPDAGMQFAISAWSRNLADGRREEVPIKRRQEWEELPLLNPGQPSAVYISRDRIPTLRLYPVQPNPVTHALDLTYQRFSADITARSVNAAMPDVRETWNLYLITALAYELGNGPVRKLPQDEVREMKAAATDLLADLEAYDAHEQANEPRRTAFNDF